MQILHRVPSVLLLALLTTSGLAAESGGCGRFAWPIDAEARLLNSSEKTAVTSGTELNPPPSGAILLTLTPWKSAALPMPPERQPKSDTAFAGFVRVAGMTQPGVYKLSLSAEVWVDVIEDGRYLKPTAFSGAPDCPGIRKSVKFQLGSGLKLIQISGAQLDTVALTLTPAP